MISIINNILSNNGYKRVDIDLQLDIAATYLYCPSDLSTREEYFVTVRLHTQSDAAVKAVLEEQAQELFEAISYSGKIGESFEKNCTMLLCHDEDEIDRQTMLELEEDQYNFKKNVIAYTHQEFVALQAYLAQEKIEKITNNVINSIINAESGKSFLEFKENNKKQNDHYSLILKAALKLPFVTYIPQEQQLTNLLLEIKDSLPPDQSSIYSQLVNLDVEWAEENIHQQVERIWGGLV
ncbi:MAG: hypothetical protein JKY93_12880 [Gammaproteobacteria bacterium]|nr:hypothetical protein [Gammaproteobacteria bacterium]